MFHYTPGISGTNMENQNAENIVDKEKHLNFLEDAKSVFETKKITNLNTDCMEIILKHLKLSDLLNIADSSKEFYSAACLVYKRQYANSYIIFNSTKHR